MPLKAQKQTSNSTPAPAGMHVARCVRVIDLGTQKEDSPWGLKENPKIMLSFELPNELHVFRDENGPEPFMVSAEYPVFLADKANLYKLLKGWRAKDIPEKEREGYDFSKLLGQPCMLTVVHKESKKGTTFANIEAAAPMMKGMVCPPAVLPLIAYDVDQGQDHVFKSLPEWVQKKILNCENWKEGFGSRPDSEESAQADTADQEAEAQEEKLPF